MSRWFRPLLVLTGLALVGYLVARIGPAAIWSSFVTLGWRLPIVIKPRGPPAVDIGAIAIEAMDSALSLSTIPAGSISISSTDSSSGTCARSFP